MTTSLIPVGARVSYDEGFSYQMRQGEGVVVGYYGHLPPRCILGWVLYEIKLDNGEVIEMWHNEIVEVLK